MPKEAHSEAADHHETAAKSHRTAAEHHSKGDHTKGREKSSKARTHSKTAPRTLRSGSRQEPIAQISDRSWRGRHASSPASENERIFA